MSDDRPRRARTHGRDQRRSDPRGYPIHVDPEMTPPPSEPPKPDTLDGYDTISPPIQHQLEVLADGLGQATAAIGKMWDLRDTTRFDRMEANLAAIAKSTTMHEAILGELRPQLDRWRAATDHLAGQLPRLTSVVEALTLQLGSLDTRLRNVEVTVAKLGENVADVDQDVNQRFAIAEAHRVELDKRMRTLEDERTRRDASTQAIAKQERKKSNKLSGLIAAVVAAVGAVISHFAK